MTVGVVAEDTPLRCSKMCVFSAHVSVHLCSEHWTCITNKRVGSSPGVTVIDLDADFDCMTALVVWNHSLLSEEDVLVTC